ncbi:MAG: class I SAM-dependent methyltransferase [Acidimicrobiia bacterium]
MSWILPTPEGRRAYWDDRFGGDRTVFGQEPNRFVAEYLAGLAPCSVLDLGAGQGRNAVWLATQGHRVTAVDLSPIAGEQTRAAATAAGVEVETVTADLTTWAPPGNAFDLVLLSYLQLVPEQRAVVHAAAASAVAPGGMVFLIAHHADNLEHGIGGPQIPDVLFVEADLAADFSAFDIERLGPVRRPVAVEGGTVDAIDIVMIARRPAERPRSSELKRIGTRQGYAEP